MKNRPGSLTGWIISLVVHAIALGWLVQQAPVRKTDDTPERRTMLVLLTVRPQPQPAPVAKPITKPIINPITKPKAASQDAPSRPAHRATRQSADPAPRQAVIAVDQPSSVPIDTPGAAPVFDVDAARATARSVAREGRAGTVLGGQATPLRETREEKLQRAYEQARRHDCKTAYAGMQLLAILPLIRDTVTDSGCKW